MSYMKYDHNTLTEVYQMLQQFHGDLANEAQNLQQSATKLAGAWEGNKSLEAFQQTKAQWDQQFGKPGDESPETALGRIDALSNAVQQALNNAVSTDNSIANSLS